MSRFMAAVLLILGSLVVAAPSAQAFWAVDGVPLCMAPGAQYYPRSTPDGAGGAIVAWADARTGTYGIYVQRVNEAGVAQWTAGGVAICDTTAVLDVPQIIFDYSGGAIVVWRDNRNWNWDDNLDIYAQRIDASGVPQWGTNGVPICTAAGSQIGVQVATDADGGAIIAWEDPRNGYQDIYAQRIDGNGIVQWTTDGVNVCPLGTGPQGTPGIVKDNVGGAIIAWTDLRSISGGDIYAQRLNAEGAAQWAEEGVAVCAASYSQQNQVIAEDNWGGAVIAWEDYRSNSNYDIYAQRLDGSGTIQWPYNGVAVCAAARAQMDPEITFDIAGGAVVAWRDYRSNSRWDVYAQRIGAAGAVQWAANGVALSIASTVAAGLSMTTDGYGGAVVSWADARVGENNLYAQRVNASGIIQWPVNGLAICDAPDSQGNPHIFWDVLNVIFVWQDQRSGTFDIYADVMWVGGLEPYIVSVLDVPGDQGGLVRLTIDRSRLDDPLEPVFPIAGYNVWQLVDDPLPTAQLALLSDDGGSSVPGLPVKEWEGRRFVQSKDLGETGELPPGTWELVGSFYASQQDQYLFRARTLADSTESDEAWSTYVVTAHTTTPSVWYASEAAMGYSVDNLPPGSPSGVAAEQQYEPAGLALSWAANAENDLSHYAVYRGTSEDFVPGDGNRLAIPTTPDFLDTEWSWSSEYYYKISAVDVHGNESGFALLVPDNITGTDTPKAPAASYLAQNFPNPFNPTTRIAFGLKSAGNVSLRIYDASGRLVRVLIDEARPAGNYSELWDGRDSRGARVASGIYFYRLTAPGFDETKKMALMR